SGESGAFLDTVDNIGRRLDILVPAAAAESAFAILDTIDKQSDRETLLRPASNKDIASKTLLRPARSGSETDPRKLLRPSGPEDREGGL
ncbi:MAG TPA: hypothetical protein VKU84_16330, partial [Stellaceae bacterium]|nr:hypothetical protein [Stellaceae bacterium]